MRGYVYACKYQVWDPAARPARVYLGKFGIITLTSVTTTGALVDCEEPATEVIQLGRREIPLCAAHAAFYRDSMRPLAVDYEAEIAACQAARRMRGKSARRGSPTPPAAPGLVACPHCGHVFTPAPTPAKEAHQ